MPDSNSFTRSARREYVNAISKPSKSADLTRFSKTSTSFQNPALNFEIPVLVSKNQHKILNSSDPTVG